MPVDDKLAKKQLDLLLGEGALRLVTPRVRPGREDLPDTRPDKFEHEVVAEFVDHPNKRHLLRAVTKQGSWVDGTPADLLVKLQDWQR
jgi:hypothetical protein